MLEVFEILKQNIRQTSWLYRRVEGSKASLSRPRGGFLFASFPLLVQSTLMISRPYLVQAIRSFSSTAVRPHGFVSNIGRQPIKFQPSVTLTATPTSLNVQGPLGETSVALEPFIKLVYPQPDTLQLFVEDPSLKKQRQMWGLTRGLINNAIIGMTEGFSVNLYLVGVGYRAAMEDDPRGTEEGGNGKRLNMKLGFSHSVYQPIPADIKAEVPSPTKISLFCTNKQHLGSFAAEIREWRKPEPYKGKVCNKQSLECVDSC